MIGAQAATVPDRDEHLLGVHALEGVLRVLQLSLAEGVPLPSALHTALASTAATVLRVLETLQCHSHAMLALTRHTTPLVMVTHLRPIVEGWLVMEQISDTALSTLVPPPASGWQTVLPRDPAWPAALDGEWREDLHEAWRLAESPTGEPIVATPIDGPSSRVAAAETASLSVNHLTFLASRLVARAWMLAAPKLGLPIVPSALFGPLE